MYVKYILKDKLCLKVFRGYLCVNISYLYQLMVEACSNVFDHAPRLLGTLFVAVIRTWMFSHITPYLKDLHWLPVHIEFKW